MEDKHYETMIAPTTFNEWDLEALRVFDLEDNPMKRYGRDCETDYLRTNPYTNAKKENDIS